MHDELKMLHCQCCDAGQAILFPRILQLELLLPACVLDLYSPAISKSFLNSLLLSPEFEGPLSEKDF